LSNLKITLHPEIGPNSIRAVALVGIEVSGTTGIGVVGIVLSLVELVSHHHPPQAVSQRTNAAVAHLFLSKKIPSREETELEIRDWAGAEKKLLVDFPIPKKDKK
jgi:hypothetical protein